MKIPFIKMDGLGNDFVIIDGRKQKYNLTAEQISRLGNRRTGIGFDQLFVLENSAKADVKMLIFNADGSPAGACGNGTRCIAKTLFTEGYSSPLALEAPTGEILTAEDGPLITVNMGEPLLIWSQIPLAEECDTLSLPITLDGYPAPTAVSMGNPHAVFFVKDIAAVALEKLGPIVENHPLFPKRTNVEFAQIINDNQIRMRVWERGAGITMACGSGACATLVAAVRKNLIKGRKADIIMDGGVLTIEWQKDGGVLMKGPVHKAFEGTAFL